MLEQLRQLHQELMGILQQIMDFAHPQFLFELTSLFLLCLSNLFFTQESLARAMSVDMYITGGLLAATSFLIFIIVHRVCRNAQRIKDQV